MDSFAATGHDVRTIRVATPVVPSTSSAAPPCPQWITNSSSGDGVSVQQNWILSPACESVTLANRLKLTSQRINLIGSCSSRERKNIFLKCNVSPTIDHTEWHQNEPIARCLCLARALSQPLAQFEWWFDLVIFQSSCYILLCCNSWRHRCSLGVVISLLIVIIFKKWVCDWIAIEKEYYCNPAFLAAL